MELGPAGITVNAISPGLTRTGAASAGQPEELFAAVRDGPGHQAHARARRLRRGARVPRLRPGAQVITGQTISADAGLVHALMAGRLHGKVALISGTAVGMGRAAAQVFAAEGALVFGCDMDTEGQAQTEALVREAGGTIASLAPVDLATEAGAEAWVAAAVQPHTAASTSSTTTPRACVWAPSASSRSRTGRSPSTTSCTCRSCARGRRGRT